MTGDSSAAGTGKALPSRPCQWANCDRPAVMEAGGWLHCRPHLREHHELVGEDYRAMYGAKGGGACGSLAAYARHRRRGEEPCEPCKDARRASERANRTSGDAA